MNALTSILPFRYFALILALVVALLFAFALGNLIITGYQLNTQAAQAREQIALLRAENARLTQRADYLKTDEAIEALAREQLGWVRPGDIPIVVVPVPDGVATAHNEPPPPPAPVLPNWVRWLRFLLGNN